MMLAFPSPREAGRGWLGEAKPGEGHLSLVQAKRLRKDMTDAERRLWYRLRAHRFDSYKFKRQIPIGPYIVDFACLGQKLIIEVDGGNTRTIQTTWRAIIILRPKVFACCGFGITTCCGIRMARLR